MSARAPAAFPAAARRFAARFSFGALLTWLFRRDAQRRSRRRLAELEDHLLSDIGVTRAQALAAAERPDTQAPRWDAPARWHG